MSKEEDKNISNFHKGNEIANKIVKILQNRNADIGEDQQLRDFIISNKYSDELFENLTDPKKISTICSKYCNSNKIDEANALVTILNRRSKINRRRRIAYATTSVAAVLTLFFVFIFSDRQSDHQEISLNHIEKQTVPVVVPVTTVAVPVLILSSGEEVKLNNRSNSDLVKKAAPNNILKNNEKVDYSDSINKIIIPNKYTFAVTLEDGTEVLLNGNSEFSYPVKFKKNKREVFLKGEGYFRVSKGVAPFIVTTNDISVKVYGTEFNVNANNQDVVETILVEGSVGVTAKGEKEVVMIPNQMFRLNSVSGASELKDVNPETYLGWVKDLFKCQNATLSSVLDEMAKWYDVQFDDSNVDCKDIIMTIAISRTTKLEDILIALEAITNLKFIKETPNKYVIESP